jgi:hypothetical protein
MGLEAGAENSSGPGWAEEGQGGEAVLSPWGRIRGRRPTGLVQLCEESLHWCCSDSVGWGGITFHCPLQGAGRVPCVWPVLSPCSHRPKDSFGDLLRYPFAQNTAHDLGGRQIT